MTELGMKKNYCEWHLDDDEAGAWESACGEMWCFENEDPEGNGMKYCPFCGRHLTQRAADATPAGFEDEEFDALLDSDIDGK